EPQLTTISQHVFLRPRYPRLAYKIEERNLNLWQQLPKVWALIQQNRPFTANEALPPIRSCVQDSPPKGKIVMATNPTDQQLTAKIVTLRLNRQQLELIDRTVARGVAPDRASLVRLALKEYAGSRNQLKQRT